MAANTSPIFSRLGITAWPALVITAVNTLDGDLSSSDVKTVLTGAADGTYVQKLRVKALGTNIATVMRIYLNNGSTAATAANNSLIDELTIPLSTASATTSLATYDIPLNFIVPNGYKILVALGTTVAAGFKVTAIGGDY